jgi:hypothetical protein
MKKNPLETRDFFLEKMGQGTRDKGQGTRDKGRVKRDEGRGTREKRKGKIYNFNPIIKTSSICSISFLHDSKK